MAAQRLYLYSDSDLGKTFLILFEFDIRVLFIVLKIAPPEFYVCELFSDIDQTEN